MLHMLFECVNVRVRVRHKGAESASTKGRFGVQKSILEIGHDRFDAPADVHWISTDHR